MCSTKVLQAPAAVAQAPAPRVQAPEALAACPAHGMAAAKAEDRNDVSSRLSARAVDRYAWTHDVNRVANPERKVASVPTEPHVTSQNSVASDPAQRAVMSPKR
jgi:hypothetical protein